MLKKVKHASLKMPFLITLFKQAEVLLLFALGHNPNHSFAELAINNFTAVTTFTYWVLTLIPILTVLEIKCWPRMLCRSIEGLRGLLGPNPVLLMGEGHGTP